MRFFRIISLALVTMLPLTAGAASGRGFAQNIRYGIEWGYTGTIYENHRYVYLTDEGARVESDDHSAIYNSNGCFFAYAGIESWDRIQTDLVSGYMGVVQGRRVVPLMLRETVYLNGCRNDGFKLFAEGGLCLTKTFKDQKSWIGRGGLGYRVMLGDKPAMDFFLTAHFVHDHPNSIYISEHSYIVPVHNIRMSDRDYAGISVGMALSF